MKDLKEYLGKSFAMYNERYLHLNMYIREDGLVHILSEAYGDEYDSELNISITKEETIKLFSNISVEEFVEYCNDTYDVEKILNKFNIDYSTCGF